MRYKEHLDKHGGVRPRNSKSKHCTYGEKELSKFKNNTLSPVELIKAIIDRSEKINSKINAHNFTFYEEAILNSKKSENKYFSNN
jgi:aspartyl-tRNA(Asn)/glutamyl-tRNA(Gln) amidotransferase subunit A